MPNYSIFTKTLNKDDIEVVKVLDTTKSYTQRNKTFTDIDAAKQWVIDNSTMYIVREE